MKPFSFKAILIVFLLMNNVLIGQELNSKIDGFSINPKFGIYIGSESTGGLTFGGEVNVLKNNFIYTADFYSFNEAAVFVSPVEKFQQIGLMGGKYFDKGNFRLQYQAGLGLLWGLKRTNEIINQSGFNETYKSKNFMTVGFLPKLGLKYIPASFLSVGIDLQANFNLERTAFMPMLSIEIGYLK